LLPSVLQSIFNSCGFYCSSLLAAGGFNKLMLERVQVDRLVLVPGIQATPLMFVLLEMIMRSNQDSTTQIQGLHLMSLLTHPSRCSTLVAAGGGAVSAAISAAAAGTLIGKIPASAAHSTAAEAAHLSASGTALAAGEAAMPWASILPLLGAVVTMSKSVWVHNWGIDTFAPVLRESMLVSAQVLMLASACITKQQEVCSLQETRQSNISYGENMQQHPEALVWSAMFCMRRINYKLALMEAVLTDRALSPSRWEGLAATAAAAAAGPNEAARDQVLAAFMQPPQEPREGFTVDGASSSSSASSPEECLKGSSLTTGMDDNAAVAGDMGMANSTLVPLKNPPPLVKADSAVSRGSTIAAQQLADTVPGSLTATAGAGQGFEGAVNDSHPLRGFALAGFAVLEEFGISGFQILLSYVSHKREVDLDLSRGSVLAQFSYMLGTYVGIEVVDALSVALKNVGTSCPEGFNGACFDLVLNWGVTDSVACLHRVQAIPKALASQSVAFCCNNPYCCNLQGWSELQLPQQGGRRGKGVCGGCRAACYCSESCQKEAWPLHRLACSSTSKPGA
jgi:hypothetical protein